MISFYRFVRRADNVADSAGVAAEARLGQLRVLRANLTDPSCTDAVVAALWQTQRRFGAGLSEAQELLGAFEQDCKQSRYRDWADLVAYCQRSAVPVGRFLLRLYGNNAVANEPADALCVALQVLNHLQDMPDDRRLLGRVYLPTGWLDRCGGEADFFDPKPSSARRGIIDAALDQVDALLLIAACLPVRIADARLRLQARVTLASAHTLARRLRRADPIERPVRLSMSEKFLRILPAAFILPVSDSATTARIVRQSGSSFRYGIRMLKGERRRALHAVYAFCRVVDDLADGAAPPSERLHFIDQWRHEIDRLQDAPKTPIGRELARAVRQFDLPTEELHLLLDGLSLDAVDRVRLEDDAALTFYCRAVAGSVGLLSVRIFGASAAADAFALELAHALQLVNVLRDVVEDARRNRIYLPGSRLGPVDALPADAMAVIAMPVFSESWERLGDEADRAFEEAERLLPAAEQVALKPALLMLWSYRPLLDRMRKSGWNPKAPRARLQSSEKIRLAWLASQVVR